MQGSHHKCKREEEQSSTRHVLCQETQLSWDCSTHKGLTDSQISQTSHQTKLTWKCARASVVYPSQLLQRTELRDFYRQCSIDGLSTQPGSGIPKVQNSELREQSDLGRETARYMGGQNVDLFQVDKTLDTGADCPSEVWVSPEIDALERRQFMHFIRQGSLQVVTRYPQLLIGGLSIGITG